MQSSTISVTPVAVASPAAVVTPIALVSPAAVVSPVAVVRPSAALVRSAAATLKLNVVASSRALAPSPAAAADSHGTVDVGPRPIADASPSAPPLVGDLDLNRHSQPPAGATDASRKDAGYRSVTLIADPAPAESLVEPATATMSDNGEPPKPPRSGVTRPARRLILPAARIAVVAAITADADASVDADANPNDSNNMGCSASAACRVPAMKRRSQAVSVTAAPGTVPAASYLSAANETDALNAYRCRDYDTLQRYLKDWQLRQYSPIVRFDSKLMCHKPVDMTADDVHAFSLLLALVKEPIRTHQLKYLAKRQDLIDLAVSSGIRFYCDDNVGRRTQSQAAYDLSTWFTLVRRVARRRVEMLRTLPMMLWGELSEVFNSNGRQANTPVVDWLTHTILAYYMPKLADTLEFVHDIDRKNKEKALQLDHEECPFTDELDLPDEAFPTTAVAMIEDDNSPAGAATVAISATAVAAAAAAEPSVVGSRAHTPGFPFAAIASVTHSSPSSTVAAVATLAPPLTVPNLSFPPHAMPSMPVATVAPFHPSLPLAATATPPPPPPKKKSRAFAQLLSYSLESAELKDFVDYLTGLKSLQANRAEQTIQSDDPTAKDAAMNNPKAVAIMFSKYLRFNSNQPIHQLALYDEVRDTAKVNAFIQTLRDADFTWATILKYLHANIAFIDYLLVRSELTADQRASLSQTRSWYLSMKKPRQRAARRETAKRQSREQLEANGEWLPIGVLPQIEAQLQTQVTALLRARNDSTVAPSVADAVFFRRATLFTLYHKSKICRRMVYYSIDLSVWQSLPRDASGCKWLSSTSFKTEATYGRSAVIFPTDVEQMIDQYVQHFRPVLAKKRAAITDPESTALFLTAKGGRMIRLSNDIVHVFEATQNKHINITTLRKMLNSEATQYLSSEDLAALQRNDEHSDATSRVHYEKLKSYAVAAKGAQLQSELLKGAATRLRGSAETPGDGDEAVMAIDLSSLHGPGGGGGGGGGSIDAGGRGGARLFQPAKVSSSFPRSSSSLSVPRTFQASAPAAAATPTSPPPVSVGQSSRASINPLLSFPASGTGAFHGTEPPLCASSSSSPVSSTPSSSSPFAFSLSTAAAAATAATTSPTASATLVRSSSAEPAIPPRLISTPVATATCQPAVSSLDEKDISFHLAAATPDSAATPSPAATAATTAATDTPAAVASASTTTTSAAAIAATSTTRKPHSRTAANWQPEQDQAIMAHANQGPTGSGTKKISWRSLLESQPELFPGLTAEKIQWRYKNLVIKEKKKRKREDDSAVGGGGDDAADAKSDKPPKKKTATLAPKPPLVVKGPSVLSSSSHRSTTVQQPDRVLAAKVLHKKMYCRVRWVNYPTKPDSWEDSADIETSAAYQRFMAES